jgi:hypothetical protein
MRKQLLALAFLSSLPLACGPVQSPECAQLLECLHAVDENQGTTTAERFEENYGENGTCWSDTEDYAQKCTNACVDALEAHAAAFPDIPACQAGEG